MPNQYAVSALLATPASSIGQAYGSPNDPGNLLVAMVSMSGSNVQAVTDTAGNVWTPVMQSQTDGTVEVWTCASGVGGANTVTATFSMSVASRRLTVVELGTVTVAPQAGGWTGY